MTRFRTAVPARATTGVAALATIALVLGACTGGASPSASTPIIANASLPPVASEAPAPSEAASAPEASESELPSAVTTAMTACDVLTSADASSWTGTKFGPGKESKTEGNVSICTYDGPGPSVFTVAYGVAPDEATAKAAEAAQEANLTEQAESMAKLGLTVDKFPNFADNTDAAVLQGGISEGGISAAARGIFLLRGVTYVAFTDFVVGGQPPSEDAFKTKATEVLSKLP
jgi:hypothetical protein